MIYVFNKSEIHQIVQKLEWMVKSNIRQWCLRLPTPNQKQQIMYKIT